MTEVSAHSAGYEEVPRVWPFNATHKLGPDVRELLSMHCSWCVLDCGEAQSPAAAAMLTGKTGNPTLLFGSVRAAYPFELDTASGLVVGALTRGVVPTFREAKRVVHTLNTVFPSDPKNNKPFYRVWWWNKRGVRNQFPTLQKLYSRVANSNEV